MVNGLYKIRVIYLISVQTYNKKNTLLHSGFKRIYHFSFFVIKRLNIKTTTRIWIKI